MAISRYSRLITLPEIGEEGNRKLREKKVAIIGLGALGTVASELLIRMGIGNLLLIDRDIVEESNLTRQNLFYEEDLGRSKVFAAKEKLSRINSQCLVSIRAIDLNFENISFLKEADLILDCTDNLQTRFLINDYCRKEKIRWIFASAIKTSGYVLPILPEGPCLNCLFKEKNSLETCETAGVINTITQSIASIQATLAIKLLLGEKVEPKLIYYDIWKAEMRKMALNKRKDCFSCNSNYPYLKNEGWTLLKFCGSNKYQITGPKKDMLKMEENWNKIGQTIKEEHSLAINNLTLFDDGRVLIQAGSEDEAKAAYSKYIEN